MRIDPAGRRGVYQKANPGGKPGQMTAIQDAVRDGEITKELPE
jgi:hypothetical protein